VTVFVIGSLVGAAVVIGWRMREARSPVSLRKIVIPPLGMSTGFSMFLYPPARVPLAWALLALALGALVLAYPILRLSRLTVQAGEIFVRRSPAFLWVLLGLVAVRFALRSYVERFIDPLQTGALFYLLAFGMIARWRVGMLRQFRALEAGRRGELTES
jgi:membrane protein CcdC involved in cytochrome C biogenesis